ncbi:hypothetical protein N825_25445 [Skermanella stibiiresistens SB22]|uniref:NlpC/P60 domain-containing protein n=1 Tax=Skermanella stibiiresistens SB22 TaxID=1385369 RepID=W9GWF8_9PROT|nr:NlpC/P60 family protein [Skermanella stibiiresistens]EWY36782.1 hypothetical protein N825_25445 [Skermanella stibiiresistens SB22]
MVMMMPARDPAPWVADFQRLPYRLGARGPDAVDCYGLVRLVLLAVAGIEMPLFADTVPAGGAADRAALAALVAGYDRDRWRQVATRSALAEPLRWHLEPRALDVALMRIGRHVCHCGILAAPGWLLHTEDAGAGVRLDRLDRPDILPRLVAVVRHPELTEAA